MVSTNRNKKRSLVQIQSHYRPYRQPRQQEQGFVLVGALLIMLLVVIIGISATSSTILELQIAGAERVHQATFHSADGGTQLAARLIEENLGCPLGFTKFQTVGVSPYQLTTILKDTDNAAYKSVWICNATMWSNTGTPATPSDNGAGCTTRDATYFPGGYSADAPNLPHTNIKVGGNTIAAPGSGLQMVAGYEGKGKGTAGGGGQILYTIYSQHRGLLESESVVQIGWRHIIGLELTSRY